MNGNGHPGASPPGVRRGGAAVSWLLAAAVAGLAAGASGWKEDLTVTRIEVRGTKVLTEGEIVRRAGVRPGDRLFALDLFAVRCSLERNPFVGSAFVERDAPGRLILTVQEREPVAVAAAGRLVPLDAGGMGLPEVESERIFDLPVLTGLAPGDLPEPGRRAVHPALREALRVLGAARRLDEGLFRQISEVHIGPGGDLVLYTAEHGVPVRFGRGGIGEKLLKFEAFWRDIVGHRDAGELRSVDLRFRDRVVVRWKEGEQTGPGV
ncbi:MAG: FtsQ-type POTRA domain-containing protein [Bacteroidota bacterium]